MTDAKRSKEVRDTILGLLSDEETARVSTASGIAKSAARAGARVANASRA